MSEFSHFELGAIRLLLPRKDDHDGPHEVFTDGTPPRMHVSRWDIVLYMYAILTHLVDVGFDLNVAVNYYIAGERTAFWWTLAFLMIPTFINTAISIHIYILDKENSHTFSKKMTKIMIFRIFVLVFQMAPILRYIDALRYALKSRKSAQENDTVAQRKWYVLMLREDSDAALLRVFECFLEAAPQQVLQLSLMIEGRDDLKIHQILSVLSSLISMGLGLAAYQRAIRFAQEDKKNISWYGTIVQFFWHFLVSVSRITSLAVVAYLFPHWTILACITHALIMSTWLQFFEKSPFCSDVCNGVLFSLVMGFLYLFTYILPVEGHTRFRYLFYYMVCFIENVACAILWIFFSNTNIQKSLIFIPIVIVIVTSYILGIMCIFIYYKCFHPTITKHKRVKNHNNHVTDTTVL